MIFAQISSSARPAMVETKFNPFSIVKAGLVSEMMDDGLLMGAACRKVGMSSETYRYTLLAGKAQPPKRAIIQPVRFAARTVAKYQKMEQLMGFGMCQSQAADTCGASSECYSIWRLQTDATPSYVPGDKRNDPVQTIAEEVRDFAAEQRQQAAAKTSQNAGAMSREDAIKKAVKRMCDEHPGAILSRVRLNDEDITQEAHAALHGIVAEEQAEARQAPSKFRFSPESGAKIVVGDRTGRVTTLNEHGLGPDWRITSVDRVENVLVDKAELSDLAQKELATAEAQGGRVHIDHVMTVVTELSSLGPNPLGNDWTVEAIEGGLDGITVICFAVKKTDEKSDKQKILEILGFLRRSNGLSRRNAPRH